MRIIDHETFLALPEGVLYCKYDGAFETPAFKGASIPGGPDDERPFIDFMYMELIPPMNLDTSGKERVLDAVEADPEGRLEELFQMQGRDGCFDWNQKYLIWEDGDVMELRDKLDRALSEDLPDVLTKDQRERWVRLQLERPGYEIERDPFCVGYWARQLGWAKPGTGDELEGWLKADSELKEGCIEGNAPKSGPDPYALGFEIVEAKDSPGQMVGFWVPDRQLTPLETNVLEVAIDHMVEHLEDLNQFESNSEELRARLDAARTLKRDLRTGVPRGNPDTPLEDTERLLWAALPALHHCAEMERMTEEEGSVPGHYERNQFDATIDGINRLRDVRGAPPIHEQKYGKGSNQ
jgi:hypothetical protein